MMRSALLFCFSCLLHVLECVLVVVVGLEELKGKNGDGGAGARKQKKCLVELLLGV